MVFDVKPIPDVQSLTIDGKALVMRRIIDHQGNEFLRELVRTIVVRATGNGHGKPICPMVGKSQQVRGCLRRGIWARGMKRGAFM